MAYSRTDLRLLRVKGPDARAFLNGLITQRTDLPVGSGTYGALLTPQGKLVADFPMLFMEDEVVVLALPAAEFDGILKRLTMFKLKSAVDLSEMEGPLYSQIGDPRLPYADARHGAISHGFEGENAQAPEAFHAARAHLSVVEGSHDLELGKSTLLDEGLACALDWDKGCYMGQEVTARMRYRALIKRVMVSFTGTAVAGQELMVEGKKVGEVRSAYGNCGFAYVRKQFTNTEIDGLRLDAAIGLEQFPNLQEAD